jgi:hypothetical protein
VSREGLKSKGNPPFRQNLFLCGFTSGCIASLVSSEIIILALAIITRTYGYISRITKIVLLGQFYAFFFAIPIGIVFGLVIALVIRLIQTRITLFGGAIIGLISNLILGLISVHTLFYSMNVSVPLSSFEFLIIFLYLVSGSWCGREIARCKIILSAKDTAL